MFALAELLLLVAVGWVIVKVARRANESRRLGPPGRRGRWVWRDEGPPPSIPPGTPTERSETMEVRSRTGDERAELPTPSQTQPLSPTAQREQKMLELRRRYVADEISVEVYEQELDKLMRGN